MKNDSPNRKNNKKMTIVLIIVVGLQRKWQKTISDSSEKKHKKKMIPYIEKETNRGQLRSVGRENDKWTVFDSAEKKNRCKWFSK